MTYFSGSAAAVGAMHVPCAQIGDDGHRRASLNLNWESDVSVAQDAALASLVAVATYRRVDKQLAIATISLVARAVGFNPRPQDYDMSLPLPNEATWRKITFHVVRRDGADVLIELLRPAEWIEALGLKVGAITAANYPELELDGVAEVLAIEACPPIHDGFGSPVIGRIVTRNATNLVRLRFADGTDLVGTDRHPIWDPLTEEWRPMCEWSAGDLVLAND